MSGTEKQMEWDGTALEKYNNMIRRIPLFHREIAQQVVEKKAEENARERGSNMVEEDDILKAFFSEIPKGLYSVMIRLLDAVGFNYHKYD